MIGIDSLITGGANIASGVINNLFAKSRQEDAQEFNKQEALDNRNFQMAMSNSAYQRSMQDMRLAGLNPILAYQKGGASTPSGGQASTTPAPVHDIGIGAAVSTAMAHTRLKQEIQNMKETNANIAVDTAKKQAEVTNVFADTQKKITDTRFTDTHEKEKANQVVTAAAEAAAAKIQQGYLESNTGSWLRTLSHGGKDVSGILSPVTSAVGAWRGAMGGMRDHSAWKYNQRWYGD